MNMVLNDTSVDITAASPFDLLLQEAGSENGRSGEIRTPDLWLPKTFRPFWFVRLKPADARRLRRLGALCKLCIVCMHEYNVRCRGGLLL